MDLNEYDVKAIESICVALVMIASFAFLYLAYRDDR